MFNKPAYLSVFWYYPYATIILYIDVFKNTGFYKMHEIVYCEDV